MTQERKIHDAVKAAVSVERERSAAIADDLAERWEKSAVNIRMDGTFYSRSLWPPFKRIATVRPRWEQSARDVEAGANGLRIVARLIRDGAIRV